MIPEDALYVMMPNMELGASNLLFKCVDFLIFFNEFCEFSLVFL